MPELTINGVTLHYEWAGLPFEGGESGAPVLVLSHSLGASGAMWRHQVKAWGEHFSILLPDHRGHGRSSLPDGPYSIQDFGRDTLALLDALDLPRVRFCGVSLGGMTGLWLAQEAPERVERMAVCNTAARIEDPALLRERMVQIERDGLESIVEGVLERWFRPATRESQPGEIELARRMVLGTPAAGYAATGRAVCELDLREGLAGIEVPALVVAGRFDEATPPAWGQAIAKAIPEVRYEELEAAHLSNWDAADEFNEVVGRFLSGGR